MIKTRRGFTLIEILIASSIFSLVILGLYSAFQTGIFAYNRIDSAFNIYQTARILFNRMESDLKNSFIYSEDDSKFQGTGSGLEFFSAVDSFTESTSVVAICRIKYYLEADSLKRSCQQGLDALQDGADIEGEELSADVKEVSLQYAYSKGIKDKPFEWQDSWPQENVPESKKTLPLAVKIKLSLIERDRHKKETQVVEFTKIVLLPLSKEGLGE
jgi:prepilin-type N-terminal cleavage/methylation domain-containing protein